MIPSPFSKSAAIASLLALTLTACDDPHRSTSGGAPALSNPTSSSPSAAPASPSSSTPEPAPSPSAPTDTPTVPSTHSSANAPAPATPTPNVALSNESETPGLVAFRPNGRSFAAGLGNKVSIVPTSGDPLIPLPDHPKPVRAIVFSNKGDRFATVDESGIARVWDPGSGKLIAELPSGPKGEVYSIVFSDDSKRLASANGAATIWDIDKKKLICSTTQSYVFDLAFTRDMGSLITTGNGEMARLDAGTCQVKAEGSARTGGTFGSWVAPDGKHVAASAPDGHGLSLFDGKSFKGLGNLATSFGCDDHIGPLAYSRDGEVLLATGSYRWFRSIRLDSMKTIAAYDVPKANPVDQMVMFGDGQRLLLVRGDKGELVSAPSKTVAFTMDLKGARTFDISWDMKLILGAGAGSAHVWDAGTGAVVKRFEMPR